MQLVQNIKQKSMPRNAMILFAAITIGTVVATDVLAAGRGDGGGHIGAAFGGGHTGGGFVSGRTAGDHLGGPGGNFHGTRMGDGFHDGHHSFREHFGAGLYSYAGSGGRSGPATDPAAQHHLIGSKGIAMHTGRFERTAPSMFFLAACVGFFGACAAAIPAPHAQGTNRPLSAPPPLLDRVPSMPPPIFNPSSPYTVPQTRETPVSPASPGSIFGTSPSPGVN